MLDSIDTLLKSKDSMPEFMKNLKRELESNEQRGPKVSDEIAKLSHKESNKSFSEDKLMKRTLTRPENIAAPM